MGALFFTYVLQRAGLCKSLNRRTCHGPTVRHVRKSDLCQEILIPVCRSPVLGRKEHYMSRSPCVEHTKYFTCESKHLCIYGQERCMEEKVWILQSLWDICGSQLCLWLYIHKIKIRCKVAVAKAAFGGDRERGRECTWTGPSFYRVSWKQLLIPAHFQSIQSQFCGALLHLKVEAAETLSRQSKAATTQNKAIHCALLMRYTLGWPCCAFTCIANNLLHCVVHGKWQSINNNNKPMQARSRRALQRRCWRSCCSRGSDFTPQASAGWGHFAKAGCLPFKPVFLLTAASAVPQVQAKHYGVPVVQLAHLAWANHLPVEHSTWADSQDLPAALWKGDGGKFKKLQFLPQSGNKHFLLWWVQKKAATWCSSAEKYCIAILFTKRKILYSCNWSYQIHL